MVQAFAMRLYWVFCNNKCNSNTGITNADARESSLQARTSGGRFVFFDAVSPERA